MTPAKKGSPAIKTKGSPNNTWGTLPSVSLKKNKKNNAPNPISLETYPSCKPRKVEELRDAVQISRVAQAPPVVKDWTKRQEARLVYPYRDQR